MQRSSLAGSCCARCPEPNCGGEYEFLFGTNLTFGAAVCQITAPTLNLRKPSVTANSRLFKALTKAAETELAAIPANNSVKARLETYFIEKLAIAGVSLEVSARALGLSSRQLQSELRRQDTGYQTVLANVRRRLAERYPRDTDLPMTEIALMLGFSELSAFTRAARGWFNRTPSEMRGRLRASAQED